MFQTVTTRFQEYKHPAKKKCKCDACGKTFTRQRTFTATRNPWNKNELGLMKTGAEIYADLKIQADAWKLKKEPHGCEKEASKC